MSSYVSVTDQFCGCGGSSLGASLAGAEIKLALNHWPLAVQTHNTNFPNTNHDCTDISACDPRRYPSTDILITSPECTNHSLAKGKIRKWRQQLDLFGEIKLDPAEERSRATMWDVCRFAEAHHYRIIIVENVVEARHWVLFPAWLQAMHLLGYEHQVVYLNSMFAHPTPQSRDRMYMVFWKKALRRPNLHIRPLAYCIACGCDIAAVQSWKNPRKPWGKYGAQYLYRCPECASEVTPYYYCAANAIDWTLPIPRIGDRKRPLKEKTLRRIKVGLEKFGRRALLIGNYSPGWARSTTDPTGTITATDHHALVTPFLVDLAYTHGHDRRSWPVTAPVSTQTSQQSQALVVPPLLFDFVHSDHDSSKVRSVEQPWPTQIATVCHAIVVPPFLVDMTRTKGIGSPVTEAYPTQTATELFGLAVPSFLVSTNYFRDSYAVDRPYPTQTSGNQYALCMPPAFLASYYANGQPHELSDPIPTQDTRDRHALVVPPFIMGIHTDVSYRQLSDVLQTVVGAGNHHFLAQPGETPAVEECGFRMLQPHEIGAAMAFPADYVVLGNQREKVKQYGNAVTPPVMKLLFERVVEVLS
jgi:DNA (cytosine-5)-methyltransferase 1